MQQQEQGRTRARKFEVYAPPETVDAIRRLAARNERSVSGEVRLALSRHLEASRAEGRRDAA